MSPYNDLLEFVLTFSECSMHAWVGLNRLEPCGMLLQFFLFGYGSTDVFRALETYSLIYFRLWCLLMTLPNGWLN